MKPLFKPALAALLATATAAPALATEWNASVWGSRRAFTENVEKIAELVNEKTNGEFTINVGYGTLSNETENLDGISIGAFEMAQFCAGYHADKNPSLTVLELPFLGVTNLDEEVAVSRAVYAHPATIADLERWNAKLLMTSPMPQYNLAGVGNVRDSLESFQGMRVRATGGLGEAFEKVGATPTSVTSSEAYNAMEAGVVDTVAFAPHAHKSFRTIDIADWWTENLDPGTVNCPVVVNIDAYNDLPEAHREALDSSVDEAIDFYVANYREKVLDGWDALLEEKGVQKVRFSDEELARFREVAEPIRQEWLSQMEAQGIPGQELYDLVQETLKSHRAGN